MAVVGAAGVSGGYAHKTVTVAARLKPTELRAYTLNLYELLGESPTVVV